MSNASTTGTVSDGVTAAQRGDWETAHTIAQRLEGDAQADWLHAILHKIEPDAANARYWYARCDRSYDDFADPTAELQALASELDSAGAA